MNNEGTEPIYKKSNYMPPEETVYCGNEIIGRIRVEWGESETFPFYVPDSTKKDSPTLLYWGD